MVGEAHEPEPRIFWCNTNRGGAAGGDCLEQRMYKRRFAAAWSFVDHPTGTFNFHDHMRRVRRGDRIVFYAKDVGIIGVGIAVESRLELLFADHPDRLRAFTTEGENEEEWRIPVEWQAWDVTNPCPMMDDALRGTFIEITHHTDRVQAVRDHFPGTL